MEKKEILQSATNNIAIKSEADKKTSTKPCWLRRAWNAIKSRARKIWAWFKNADVSGMINITLLCLIIVLFSILAINLWDIRDSNNGKGGSVVFNNAPAHTTKTPTESPKIATVQKVDTATVSANIAFDTESQDVTITLPLKKVLSRNVIEKKSGNIVYLDNGNGNDLIIDGSLPDGSIIRPMAEIRGNVFLQNMHGYALPCGVKINGNLFVRNVRMLKFCGCFEVTGNIYVSSNSSFGPIPHGSRLGGRIIF